ncbi:MAG: glycosyltransferase [bacterium]|nr:glycosyltransferase [bacterium]
MISVITPSFNMLPYLKRASASVADQSLPGVEHLVIDAVSTDGTVEWLETKPFPRMRSISEPDEGMYDAINKGLKESRGDILAYLNCDEQYLPGTLEFVSGYFETHPQVDIIFGDALLTRADGSLIAFRKGYPPRWFYILSSHLYVLSCTMFFRRRILEAGDYFDTRYRAVGDADFVVRLLKKGYRAKHLKRYFSSFTMTGKNLSTDEGAIKEQKELLRNAPVFIRLLGPLLNVSRLMEKCLNGAYFMGGRLEYSVYTGTGDHEGNVNEGNHRNEFSVKQASSLWRFE